MEAEEKILEDRKRKFKEFFLKKDMWVYGVLIILLILAWYIRTINVPNLKDVTTNNYTLGPDLDPFLFLRYAKNIVETGKLMSHDSMRYVPLGYDTSKETVLLPYMIAYFHKALSFFSPSVTIEYSAVIFPVFMFLLTVIAFFLFVRKVFEDKGKLGTIIALIATAFLIVSPSLLPRTVAGIPEKESAGFLFMFLAFYFFLSAWKSEKIKNSLILAFLAGLSTTLMGLIWGGWVYVFTTLGLFVFICFIFGKINKNGFITYSLWFGWVLILLAVISAGRYSLIDLLGSTSVGICFMMFILILTDFLIFKTKIKDTNLLRKIKGKIPNRIFSVLVFGVLMIILSIMVFGISFIPNFISDTLFHLRQPYWDRLSFTVAENRQPYFSEWKGSFGPIIANIPLLFWLFFPVFLSQI